jgi:thioredoxin reductase
VNKAIEFVERPVTPKHRFGSPDYDVAVIGAGPYGLSAAAHLKAKGLGVRVFGEPMDFWADKMPEGMLLRSPRPASNISDPNLELTLEAFEAEHGMAPAAPVPLETFVNYGRWFRQRLGEIVDPRMVARIDREDSLFRLTLQNGDSLTSRRVVIAAGIGPFQKKPAALSQLSPSQVSHCYEGRKIAQFVDKRVAVIGAGQSALESAALLHEAGAIVEIIVRLGGLRWIGRHKWLHKMGPVSQLLYSKYDVGPVGISRLVANPGLMTWFPLKVRDKMRTRAVRPAGSPWLGPRLSAVKISTGRTVVAAKTVHDEVQLRLDDHTERRVDHVLLGTGYSVDISRYQFLPHDEVSQVRQFDGYPMLTSGFACSVPGLHFIGATAARSFGPLLYFVAGTEFASKKLASFISQSRVAV